MFSVLLFHIYTYLYLFLIIFSRAWRLWEGFTLGGTFVVTVHTHGEFGPNKLFIPFFFFFFLFFHSVLTLFMLYILYIDYIYVCIYYSMLIQTFDDSCSTTNKMHEKGFMWGLWWHQSHPVMTLVPSHHYSCLLLSNASLSPAGIVN